MAADSATSCRAHVAAQSVTASGIWSSICNARPVGKNPIPISGVSTGNEEGRLWALGFKLYTFVEGDQMNSEREDLQGPKRRSIGCPTRRADPLLFWAIDFKEETI